MKENVKMALETSLPRTQINKRSTHACHKGKGICTTPEGENNYLEC